MFAEFFRELRDQFGIFSKLVKTREFWLYVTIIVAFLVIAVACIRLATGFDPLTRGQLQLSFACHTGQGKLATIIIGLFVFVMACMFTLGEVVHWVEETRLSKQPGRPPIKVDFWRPVLHVVGTIVFGASGYSLMAAWCF